MKTLSKLLLCTTLAAATASASPPQFHFEIHAVDLEGVAENREEAIERDAMWLRSNQWIRSTGRTTTPASAKVELPAQGTYHIWVKHRATEVRPNPFSVIVSGIEIPFAWLPFGKNEEDHPEFYEGRKPGTDMMIWSRERVDLPAGSGDLLLTTECNPPGHVRVGPHPPVVESIVITSDPEYAPAD